LVTGFNRDNEINPRIENHLKFYFIFPPGIPSGDPIFKSGFVIGERRSRPLSKKDTQKKS